MNGTCFIAWTWPKAKTNARIIYLQNNIDVTKPLANHQEGLKNKSKSNFKLFRYSFSEQRQVTEPNKREQSTTSQLLKMAE